jgi:hypothetical protein
MQRDLEVIKRNTQTLMKHVNDLLDVAQLEAGNLWICSRCVSYV